MHAKKWIFLIVIFLLLASCNLPVANEKPVASEPAAAGSTQAPGVDVVGTAVELTTAAKMTELARSAVATVTDNPASAPTETPGSTPSPTPCDPLVTATTVANVRSGPGTVYDVVGSLPLGGTAKVAGRNDANTWWYIEFAGGVGGHAWIAGSVVTASCLPSVVQVIAAPPTPTSQPPTITPTATEDTSLPPVVGVPDLVAAGMQWSNPAYKNQPVSIQVKVTNSGTAPAGQFVVVWLSNQTEPGCDWTVSGLAAGASKVLNCTFTYTILPTKTSTFWVTLKVDTGNQVAESNEGNNEREANNLVVHPQP